MVFAMTPIWNWEFARSGIIDLYGYVDFFDILDRKQDDRHGE